MKINDVIYDKMELIRSIVNGTNLRPLRIALIKKKEGGEIYLEAIRGDGCVYAGEPQGFLPVNDVRRYIVEFAKEKFLFAISVDIPENWDQ